jgi:hypothetical protein
LRFETLVSDEETARHMVTELTAARSQRVVSAWGIAAVHASLGDADPPGLVHRYGLDRV